MATARLKLDTRRAKSDGTYPIKLRIVHQRISADIPMDISIKKEDWNTETNPLKPLLENSTRHNTSMLEKLAKAKRIIIEHEHELHRLDANDLKVLVIRAINGKSNKSLRSRSPKLLEYWNKIITDLKENDKHGTAEQYSGDQYSIRRYLKEINKSDIYMNKIDTAFLEDFRESCFKRGVKNGVVRYLKTLRAVFNKAIKDTTNSLTEGDYPFKGFQLNHPALKVQGFNLSRTESPSLNHSSMKLFSSESSFLR